MVIIQLLQQSPQRGVAGLIGHTVDVVQGAVGHGQAVIYNHSHSLVQVLRCDIRNLYVVQAVASLVCFHVFAVSGEGVITDRGITGQLEVYIAAGPTPPSRAEGAK